MKKRASRHARITTMGAILSATAFLSGCTTTSQNSANHATANSIANSTANTPANNKPVTSNETQTPAAPPTEMTLTWQQEGQTESVTATLYRSDNQDFHAYVLPNFLASAEEPGKDVVLSKLNQNAWMRIEMRPQTTDKVQLENTIQVFLKATGTPEKVTDSSDVFLQSAQVYRASNNQGTVTAFLFYKNEIPFITTVFVPNEYESISPFLAMIKTITPGS